MYKIDKKVPIPAGGANGRKYPLAAMKVGDSFFAKGMLRKTLYDSAKRWAKRNKLKHEYFVAREKSGYRLWRIK